MAATATDQSFPKGALLGAAAVIGVAIGSAALASFGGVGALRMHESAAVEARDLRFEDRRDGAIVVTDAGSGATVAVLAPGTNGFARGALRGLARERKRREIGVEPPFRLTRWADGRLSLADPTTGRRIDLEAFGPSNAGVFVRFLSDRSAAP